MSLGGDAHDAGPDARSGARADDAGIGERRRRCSSSASEAPRRTILAAIAGGYSRIVIQETRGVYLREGERTPETIAARFGEIADLTGAIHSEQPGGPGLRFLQLAAAEAGVAPGIGT